MTASGSGGVRSAIGAVFARRTESGNGNDWTRLLLRIFAGAMVSAVLLFLFNSYLTFWMGWPGVPNFLADRQWFGVEPLNDPLQDAAVGLGWIQFLLYPAALAGVIGYVMMTPAIDLRSESARLSELANFIVRAAFWSVFLVGLADGMISFLRVEGLLSSLVGEALSNNLGLPKFRGAYVHYPLMALALVIAAFTRSLGFPWLALLIVIAEFQIVLSRFIFSYEQIFMADMVRFWYASLFLFSSAYALLHEGHVRVDVFYAGFSRTGKARTNAIGSIALGLPLCWVILMTGMWDRGGTLINPLTSFEISQSGFGMFVKYLMAGFLIVFAISMAVQFTAYFLSSVADLRGDPGGMEEEAHAEV